MGFSGSVIFSHLKAGIREIKQEGSEMRDCFHERDLGIGDFEERDSGNNHLNEPRTGMSVDEDLRNLSSQS